MALRPDRRRRMIAMTGQRKRGDRDGDRGRAVSRELTLTATVPRPAECTRAAGARRTSNPVGALPARLGVDARPHVSDARAHRPHDRTAAPDRGHVLVDDQATHELVICSAWGPGADWIRNLHAAPPAEILIGRDRFVAAPRFLTDDEAVAAGNSFRQRHRYRLWLIGTILGWGDLGSDKAMRRFVHAHPFVAFRPASSFPSDDARLRTAGGTHPSTGDERTERAPSESVMTVVSARPSPASADRPIDRVRDRMALEGATVLCGAALRRSPAAMAPPDGNCCAS